MNDDLEAWLKVGAASGESCRRMVETPIAKVFLFDRRVLKIKKAVDFGFVDFSTVEKREWAIRRELEFNRRTAPDVYRAVHPVRRSRDGRLSLGGEGETVEWALEMRPFDPGAILSNRLDHVDAKLAETLGRDIARFHARAGPVSGDDRGGATLDYVLRSNAEQFRDLGAVLDQAQVARVERLQAAELDRLRPLLDARRDAGLVRRCHGDLHLGNIVVEEGRPVLFDCIEFSDVLAEIDVLYDVAFLLMDLDMRGRRDAANGVMNAWLDESARTVGEEIWTGLQALPLFQSVRAAVRAHVSGHNGEPDKASDYLAAAERHLEAARPRLFAVGGLSGSGKSVLARTLAPRVAAAPGAVVLRSDEVRKRLWGSGPRDRLPPEAYTPEASVRVYGSMVATAELCLRAGRTVVLDATFLEPHQRAAAESLGRRTGVALEALWLDAPSELLRQRIHSRRDDASDADARVLDAQLARGSGEVRWRRLDAAEPAMVSAVRLSRLGGTEPDLSVPPRRRPDYTSR